MSRQSGAWNIRTSRSVGADLEVLASTANADLQRSVVLDASTVVADTDGVLRLVAGTPLSKNVSNQYEKYVGAAGQTVRGILAETIEFPDNLAHSDAPSSMWCHGQEFQAGRLVGYAAAPADGSGGTIGDDIRAALPTCRVV